MVVFVLAFGLKKGTSRFMSCAHFQSAWRKGGTQRKLQREVKGGKEGDCETLMFLWALVLGSHIG